MVSRSTIAASLVVVALLAGCSGLVGNGGPGSPEDVDLAAGFAADGIADGDRALDSYRTSLGETDSYTVTYQQNASAPRMNATYVGEYRVDVDGERAYHRSDVRDGQTVREDYFADGRHFTRLSRGDQTNSASQESEFVQRNLTGATVLEPLVKNEIDYETSLGERDGTTVVVYETSGAESAAAAFDVDAANVTAFTATFAVDADGVVRDASYDLTYVGSDGSEQRVTMSFEVHGLGDTDVERPDWATDE